MNEVDQNLSCFIHHLNTKLMSRNQNIGLLILRVSIGFMLLLHGIFKVVNGFSGIKGMLAGMGVPEFFAYGALVGEVVAPRAPHHRTSHTSCRSCRSVQHARSRGDGTQCSHFLPHPHGGWAIELPMLFFFPSLALIFTGGGKYIISSHTCLD